jgi:hypothetical protein
MMTQEFIMSFDARPCSIVDMTADVVEVNIIQIPEAKSILMSVMRVIPRISIATTRLQGRIRI